MADQAGKAKASAVRLGAIGDLKNPARSLSGQGALWLAAGRPGGNTGRYARGRKLAGHPQAQPRQFAVPAYRQYSLSDSSRPMSLKTKPAGALPSEPASPNRHRLGSMAAGCDRTVLIECRLLLCLEKRWECGGTADKAQHGSHSAAIPPPADLMADP